MQSAHGDADVIDKEMQINYREFINERDSRNNHLNSHSRLRNIDNLMDIRFNLTRFSPIPTVGDTVQLYGKMDTKHMYSIYIYKSLLVNVSVSLIVSEVLLHMTVP